MRRKKRAFSLFARRRRLEDGAAQWGRRVASDGLPVEIVMTMFRPGSRERRQAIRAHRIERIVQRFRGA